MIKWIIYVKIWLEGWTSWSESLLKDVQGWINHRICKWMGKKSVGCLEMWSKKTPWKTVGVLFRQLTRRIVAKKHMANGKTLTETGEAPALWGCCYQLGFASWRLVVRVLEVPPVQLKYTMPRFHLKPKLIWPWFLGLGWSLEWSNLFKFVFPAIPNLPVTAAPCWPSKVSPVHQIPIAQPKASPALGPQLKRLEQLEH